MKGFAVDLYFATVQVNKTRVIIIDGDYKHTIGTVSYIRQINEKTGFISFGIKTDDGRIDLTADNLSAKELIGEKGYFEYSEIDQWLLDFEKISQETREDIVEDAFNFTEQYPNYEIKATEEPDCVKLTVNNGDIVIAFKIYKFNSSDVIKEIVNPTILKIISIAKFMGINPLKGIDSSKRAYYYYNNPNLQDFEPLPSYDTSWCDLMEVVEKIEEDPEIDVNILLNGTIIFKRKTDEHIVDNVADISFDKKIEHTFDAVAKYVQLLEK